MNQNVNERQFYARLVSVDSELITRNNEKRTQFAPAVIEMTVGGKPTRFPAIINKGNLDYGMEVGQEYLCTATRNEDGKVYISVSHLTSNRLSMTEERFNSLFGTKEVQQKATALTQEEADAPF